MGIERMIHPNPDNFSFERKKTEGGGVYTMQPLTLELYDQRVKYKTLLHKSFSTLEDLLSALEETIKTQW